MSIERRGHYHPLKKFKERLWRKGMREIKGEGLVGFIPGFLKKKQDIAGMTYILNSEQVKSVEDFLNGAKLPEYTAILLGFGLNLASIKEVNEDELFEAGIIKEFHRKRYIRVAKRLTEKRGGGGKKKSLHYSGTKGNIIHKRRTYRNRLKRRGINKRSRKNISKRKKKYHLKKTKRKSKQH